MADLLRNPETLAALVASLRARGVTFVLDGVRLRIRPWPTLTAEEADIVQANRPALKALVRAEGDAGPTREPPPATAVPAPAPAPTQPAARVQCAFMNPNGMQCALDPMPGITFCEYHSIDRDAHLKKENYELWLEVHSDSEEAIEVRRLRATMVMLRMMFKTSPYL